MPIFLELIFFYILKLVLIVHREFKTWLQTSMIKTEDKFIIISKKVY